MERLGDIVARVLANVRDTMDGEEKAGDREGPRQVAARHGGGGVIVRGKSDAHASTSQRRPAYVTTGTAANSNMRR